MPPYREFPVRWLFIFLFGTGDQTRLIKVRLGRADSPGYTEPRFASAGDGLVCIFALAGRRAKIKVATSF